DPEIERPASQPVHGVAALRDVRIPVGDGLELSANLWLPEPRPGSGTESFPAILEMIPYRKDDWRAASDESRGEWLAARGYALCRLDVRGTGSSPGIALDEYTARETQDGYDAVEWLAGQPWCNGKVGMWGISYGGFTAIQVAKLRPPHLAAIVPMYATDDRYTADVHYIGGCVTVSELSQYAVSMVGMNALPARAEFRGAGWADEWRARLEQTPIWLFEWLRQQHDGPYWRLGSLAPDYETITTPMLLFGGWMDSYVDPVLRMMERCTAPRRAIIGNWVHSFPDDAYPGPNFDWLHEMVRFFDHWLKGIENGVMEEPAFTVFRHEFAEPEPFPAGWPGAWLALPSWPVAGVGERVLHLAAGDLPLVGGLADKPPAAAAVVRFRHRATSGTGSSLSWGAGGAPNGLARDLRPEESLVPTFTSAALDEPLDILGTATAVLAWVSSVPVATAVVRLADVAPDGTSAQVTAGILNLTHRDSHTTPAALEPGVVTEVRVPLRSTAHRFLPGHRIRLSVATSAWPVVWPSPAPAEHALHLGGSSGSRLILPTIPLDGGADALRPVTFKTTPAGQRDVGSDREDAPVWRITEDVIDGSVTVSTSEFAESTLPDGRSTLYTGERLEMTARDADPAHARMFNEVVYRVREAGSEILIEASGTLRSTATDFHMNVGLRVTIDGAPFFERGWLETIPRRLV
ncbi:MAG TPA: CocE/NonD family hydrolase, partial [Candidatus Limnocylindrales bacterium]|nr:CocE/NonD family hydrolase [Candidatus Limnocylindrales bacterium]